MRKILYFANPASPHFSQWLGLLDDGVSIDIATINNSVELESIPLKVGRLYQLPRVFKYFPKPLRYLMLGFVVRILNKSDSVVHAHNTSGYGLSAHVSGKRFIITTYGSEIYRTKNASFLYRFLLKNILKRAVFITASTPYMEKYLLENFPFVKGKVFVFSLGVRDEYLNHPFLGNGCGLSGSKPVWFVNRRVLPLYRTMELVKAFSIYKSKGGMGKLILLQGDASGDYVDKVRYAANSVKDIEFVEGFVDVEKMIELLDRSDFIISVPMSDQLSSSILEGMARGCMPILADLKAYEPVKKYAYVVKNRPNYGDSLERMFFETCAHYNALNGVKHESFRKVVMEKFSIEHAKSMYKDIIRKHCGLL